MHVCDKGKYLDMILTELRDIKTTKTEFRKYAEFLGNVLIQTAVDQGYIPTKQVVLTTPTNSITRGVRVCGKIHAVSILRAGNAFLPCLLRLLPGEIDIGQLVIQRDEKTTLPKILLEKIDPSITQADCVFVLDPMLATGGSIIAAIHVLLARGVEVEKIVLIHGLASLEGVMRVEKEFPGIRGIIGVIDEKLNEYKYIIPGLGDFGDRYY